MPFPRRLLRMAGVRTTHSRLRLGRDDGLDDTLSCSGSGGAVSPHDRADRVVEAASLSLLGDLLDEGLRDTGASESLHRRVERLVTLR